jgi:hypothetical protein
MFRQPVHERMASSCMAPIGMVRKRRHLRGFQNPTKSCADRERHFEIDGRLGEFMKLRLGWWMCGAWLAAVTGIAPAAQIEHAPRRTSGDIEFHYGLMPAELVARHADDHVERKMHGGGESASDTHLVVALFDRKSGARISDAEVEASVTLLGGASMRKRLERMTIADQPSYGAYFPMGVPGLYRIRFEARRAGAPGIAYAEFEHRVGREGSAR